MAPGIAGIQAAIGCSSGVAISPSSFVEQLDKRTNAPPLPLTPTTPLPGANGNDFLIDIRRTFLVNGSISILLTIQPG